MQQQQELSNNGNLSHRRSSESKYTMESNSHYYEDEDGDELDEEGYPSKESPASTTPMLGETGEATSNGDPPKRKIRRVRPLRSCIACNKRRVLLSYFALSAMPYLPVGHCLFIVAW